MKKMEAASGEIILIDNDDYAFLSQWTWHLADGYASRNTTQSEFKGQRKRILMHRVLNKTPEGLCTDHINGNRLDNRKRNLRNATKLQNSMNRKGKASKVSRYKGVCRTYSNANPWRASIKHMNTIIHLGVFKTEYEAAIAYNQAALKHFGEYARVNQLPT